jgi:hypothetical protein
MRDLQKKVKIVKAGIDRFYSEGYTRWSRVNFEKLLQPEPTPNDPRVQELLREWEKTGVIRVVGTDDCYIEILKQFPDE